MIEGSNTLPPPSTALLSNNKSGLIPQMGSEKSSVYTNLTSTWWNNARLSKQEKKKEKKVTLKALIFYFNKNVTVIITKVSRKWRHASVHWEKKSKANYLSNQYWKWSSNILLYYTFSRRDGLPI